MARNTISRSLHDVGLAAWFGGSLMGAVGLNGAAASLRNTDERSAAATVGWNRWVPVNAAAIGAHLVGSVGQLRGNADRLKVQKGVGTMSIVKTVLTAAALGVTAYSRVLGKKISAHGDVPVEAGTEPTSTTPTEVAQAQKQLKVLQWTIPALTGALVVVTAYAGEQQRPQAVKAGVFDRLNPLSSSV